ncbi:Gelsolin-like protein 1 [Hondaea fermentalgiana]|uniref:Gelsolin-like protein 1 n=1 Tax=Hondaea fermentalgiana TaxID=2315210 RepID=A0A2R5G765_9STRA|nr:Gelsolin-like protein 1 [Hondaea fermentalgiana]|eukprot:GBG23881.1 Gelsolin-like protein 1 [Hondaea fermentalgiana]
MSWLTNGNTSVRSGMPVNSRDKPRFSWRRKLVEAKQAKLEDSNIAGIGSKENRSLAKSAAATDKEIAKAGRKVGLEVWRVENKRTARGAPDFGVKRVPTEEFGNFYSGDSYIVLNTYRPKDPQTKKVLNKLAFDLFFWIGESSSIDEQGVAAKKTVEIDDLLDDAPIQHRETQNHESKLFQSLFKEIKYISGGNESGFRRVEPQAYEPRLFMVRSSQRTTRAVQIQCLASKMNHGDAFVLDSGVKVYRWVGETASPFEKVKSGMLQCNIVNSRNGRSRKAEVDEEFWKILRGSISNVLPADQPFIPKGLATEDKGGPGSRYFGRKSIKVYRISDAAGKGVQFTKMAEGSSIRYSILDSNDAFLVHCDLGVWLWVGNGASQAERSKCFPIADQYIREHELEKGMPITALKEDQARTNLLFLSFFS